MRKNLLLTAVFAFALVCSARADLVTNGSFELGSNPPTSGFTTLSSGSTAITGWTVSSGSIDWIGTYWQASNGTHSIDLDGNAQGALEISTSLATTVGQTYVLGFDMAGNPDGLPHVKDMDVIIGGTAYTFHFNDTGFTHSNMGWTHFTQTFTATGPTTLKFASDNAGYYGAALDNVSVSEVPEPGSLMLLGSGLAGLAGVIRRKIQK